MTSITNFDNAPKLMDCIKYLLNNELNSDIQFHFTNSNVVLYGHKFIIGLRSSVFNTMFYGRLTMAAGNLNVCKIVDISADVFYEMLRFIYMDEVDITDQNFAEIMYAGHKYSINHLEKLCCNYVKRKLNADNCCMYLQQCFLYDNDLSKRCMEVIDKDIRLIIIKNTWKDLNEDQMAAILRRDSLEISEYSLLVGVMAWAEYISRKHGLDVNVYNIREKFHVLFDLIRFPTMSLEEFAKFHRHKPFFLRSEEIAAICLYISAGMKSKSLKHSTVQRRSRIASTVRHYGKITKRTSYPDFKNVSSIIYDS